MICNCQPRPSYPRHDGTCLVAQAMRSRCPDCRTMIRFGRIFHAHHCKLKEYQP